MKTNSFKKPNELQKISLGILLAAVLTLGAIPSFFNPVGAQVSPPVTSIKLTQSDAGTFTCGIAPDGNAQTGSVTISFAANLKPDGTWSGTWSVSGTFSREGVPVA